MTTLEQVVAEVGLTPIFATDPAFLVRRVDEAGRVYERRRAGFVGVPKALSSADLVAEYARNPHRVKTFLQATAFVCTPEMLAMLWLVLNGARLARIEFSYARSERSQLIVELESVDGSRAERFASDDLWDAAILKLAGLSKSDGQPLIESFYPLFIPRVG